MGEVSKSRETINLEFLTSVQELNDVTVVLSAQVELIDWLEYCQFHVELETWISKQKGFSCVPDVFTLNAADVDVIVMACDGLWDVLELRVLERVMAMIQQATLEMVGASNTGGNDSLDAYKILDKVAHTLCQYAVQVGSTDNVSVIIGARRELFPPEVLAKTPLATARFSIQM
eukprot:gnl/Chilomastix_caulleri/2205.p1 GENE.gnl/Chilomastix_caulleri/2205~~gnl/Chilomastix_caulleri/2205.p1  ORF type:complete len:174 (+),score=16.55 gnl/Chilomastix_caulleri/2205:393-914(+)